MKEYMIMPVSIVYPDGKMEDLAGKVFTSEAEFYYSSYDACKIPAMKLFVNFLSTLTPPFKVVWKEYRRNTFKQNEDWKYVSEIEQEVPGENTKGG